MSSLGIGDSKWGPDGENATASAPPPDAPTGPRNPTTSRRHNKRLVENNERGIRRDDNKGSRQGYSPFPGGFIEDNVGRLGSAVADDRMSDQHPKMTKASVPARPMRHDDDYEHLLDLSPAYPSALPPTPSQALDTLSRRPFKEHSRTQSSQEYKACHSDTAATAGTLSSYDHSSSSSPNITATPSTDKHEELANTLPPARPSRNGVPELSVQQLYEMDEPIKAHRTFNKAARDDSSDNHPSETHPTPPASYLKACVLSLAIRHEKLGGDIVDIRDSVDALEQLYIGLSSSVSVLKSSSVSANTTVAQHTTRKNSSDVQFCIPAQGNLSDTDYFFLIQKLQGRQVTAQEWDDAAARVGDWEFGSPIEVVASGDGDAVGDKVEAQRADDEKKDGETGGAVRSEKKEVKEPEETKKLEPGSERSVKEQAKKHEDKHAATDESGKSSKPYWDVVLQGDHQPERRASSPSAQVKQRMDRMHIPG
jgi:hypothetical protein